MLGRSAAAIAIAGSAGACATIAVTEQPFERFEYTSIIMAAEARIVLYAPDEPAAHTAARAAFDRMNELDAVMSDYRPDSELMRLCAGPVDHPQHVSNDLFRVLDRAREIADHSGGAFDITIGPVVRLWREARATGRPPDTTAIEEARQRCGMDLISLDPDAQTVTLHGPEMRLDLGGIGKGFAVDEAAEVLCEHGIERFLIGLAGDLRAGKPPPGSDGWRVRVPTDRNEPVMTILLPGRAISTSGDQHQFFEYGGERYSHIIDPRTGFGLTSPFMVTVIAPDAVTADALATAISVMGPQRAGDLLEQHPEARVMIHAAGDSESVHDRPAPQEPAHRD